jgi:hypothetical protein
MQVGFLAGGGYAWITPTSIPGGGFIGGRRKSRMGLSTVDMSGLTPPPPPPSQYLVVAPVGVQEVEPGETLSSGHALVDPHLSTWWWPP